MELNPIIIKDTLEGKAHNKGRLENPKLKELSGLTASGKYRGIFYGLNDSGNSAVIYRLGADGKDLGEIKVQKSANFDWEAISYGKCSFAEHCLYIADTGDNFHFRRSHKIYIIPEPDIKATSVKLGQLIEFSYNNGNHDAESMFIDKNGGIFLVHKKIHSSSKGDVPVYKINIKSNKFKDCTRLSANAEIAAYIATNDVQGQRTGSFTDAAYDKNNNLYIRDYQRVYRVKWRYDIKNPPLLVLNAIESPKMRQGEALAIVKTPHNNDVGGILLTSSEGKHAQISQFPNNQYEKTAGPK